MATLLSAILAAGGPLTTSALAGTSAPPSIPACTYTSDAGHLNPFCTTGQTTSVTVGATSSVNYTFGHQGDGSNMTVTVHLSPIQPGYASLVGVNVFDADHPVGNGQPAETATTLSNQIESNPNAMQFNYSANRNGLVTLQFFNFSPNDVTFNVDQSGLVLSGNGLTSPVTLQLVEVPGVAAPSNGCFFSLGMSLYVGRMDSPGGRLMAPVVGQCTGNEYSDPATGNVYQHTVGGTLVWNKGANRVDFNDGTSTWYGCYGGIVLHPDGMPFSCSGQP